MDFKLWISLRSSPLTDEFRVAAEKCRSSLEKATESGDSSVASSDMAGLLSAVEFSRQRYESSKRSKARKWLRRLSAKVTLCGQILDVFVQHHPEYVSLAWGTFKFVFQGVVNHEVLTKELAKALCRVSDALPQVEQGLLLYPSERMSSLVTELFVKIIEFAEKAARWYGEGKLRHAVGSILNPFCLQFKDTVNDIADISTKIEKAALSASMAELRRTRMELQDLREIHRETRELAVEMRKTLQHFHSLQYTGILDTNRRVCEIQLSQIMSFSDTTPLLEPGICLEHFRVRRNRRLKYNLGDTDFLANSLQLQVWGNSHQSSQLTVTGSFESRRVVRDFAANVIELIQAANFPVVWALDTGDVNGKTFSASDVLKYLVSQILRQNQTLLNERSAALSAVRFYSATTVGDWLSLLGSVVEGLPRLYLVLDVELLQKCITSDTTTWPARFQELFHALAARGLHTTVKVAFLSTRSSHAKQLGDFVEASTLHVPSERRCGAMKRKQAHSTRWASTRKRPKLKGLQGVLG